MEGRKNGRLTRIKSSVASRWKIIFAPSRIVRATTVATPLPKRPSNCCALSRDNLLGVQVRNFDRTVVGKQNEALRAQISRRPNLLDGAFSRLFVGADAGPDSLTRSEVHGGNQLFAEICCVGREAIGQTTSSHPFRSHSFQSWKRERAASSSLAKTAAEMIAFGLTLLTPL